METSKNSTQSWRGSLYTPFASLRWTSSQFSGYYLVWSTDLGFYLNKNCFSFLGSGAPKIALIVNLAQFALREGSKTVHQDDTVMEKVGSISWWEFSKRAHNHDIFQVSKNCSVDFANVSLSRRKWSRPFIFCQKLMKTSKSLNLNTARIERLSSSRIVCTSNWFMWCIIMGNFKRWECRRENVSELTVAACTDSLHTTGTNSLSLFRISMHALPSR